MENILDKVFKFKIGQQVNLVMDSAIIPDKFLVCSRTLIEQVNGYLIRYTLSTNILNLGYCHALEIELKVAE